MSIGATVAKVGVVLLTVLTLSVNAQQNLQQKPVKTPGSQQNQVEQAKTNGANSPELADFSGGLKPKTAYSPEQPLESVAIEKQIEAKQAVEQKTIQAPAAIPEATKRGQSNIDATAMIVSLLLVLGCIWLLAFVLKKFNMVPGVQSQAIKIITSQHLGAKEKLIVVEINNQQHVLGVTAQNINLITTLSEPISQADSKQGSGMVNQTLATKFASILNQKQQKND